MYRERERDVYVCIYIYIYYVYIERERCMTRPICSTTAPVERRSASRPDCRPSGFQGIRRVEAVEQ